MQIIIHLPEKTVEIKEGIPYESWLFGVTSPNVSYLCVAFMTRVPMACFVGCGAAITWGW